MGGWDLVVEGVRILLENRIIFVFRKERVQKKLRKGPELIEED